MMSDPGLLDVHRTLVANNLDRDRGYTHGYRYAGTLSIAGRTIEIALTFNDLEFTRLPLLTLLDPARDCPEVVAHLARDNEFCFARKEQVLLDRYQPGGSILECLRLVRASLERALTHKDPRAEIALEFPQHWLGQTVAFVDYRGTTSGSAWVYLVPRPPKSEAITVVTDRENALEVFGLSAGDGASVKSSRLPAFVYRANQTLTFGLRARQPETLAEFVAWANTVEPNLGTTLLKRAAETYPKTSMIFVYGLNGCVGIQIRLPLSETKLQRTEALNRYLTVQAAAIAIHRIECSRMDPDFILSRNLHDAPSLAGKRIALIGCGTIGSHLAKLLVQSGAGWDKGCLMLVDQDVLVPGNVGRHFLGLQHVSENKAEAMRRELLHLFPEHTILAQPTDALRQLSLLSSVDLVIDATGEEALSRSLNEYFIARRLNGAAPDILHVWLIGNGDAAQALLVGSTKHACYKCLRKGHDGAWRFNPLLSSQSAEPVFAPCGEGMFMAYGVGAPVIAAGLALQVALDWVAGDGRPYLRTICIDGRRTRPIKNQNPDKLSDCPACSSGQPPTA